VTRQLTKSRDFRQNYLCDFYLWKGNFRFKVKARNFRGDTSEKEEKNGAQPRGVAVETKGKKGFQTKGTNGRKYCIQQGEMAVVQVRETKEGCILLGAHEP
jgi:hypothetical protein